MVTDATWAFIVHSMDKNIPTRAKDFIFSQTVRTDSGPPSFLFNGYWASFHGINRPEREVDHSQSSTAEVTNEWSCTSPSPICLYGVDRHKFTFTFVVLSYLNDGLTSIKLSWEKTLELMVDFQCHQPKRFGKSNASKYSRIRRTIL